MLVNTVRIVTVYYNGMPDRSVFEQRVEFGTPVHPRSTSDKGFDERHFLLVRPLPQTPCGHISACFGDCSTANMPGSLFREHPKVRPIRGGFGDTKHPAF